MAIGTIAAVALGLAGFGGGALFSRSQGRISIPGSSPVPLPQPPSVEAAANKAEGIVRKKRAAMTQTIFTSPLGVAGEAQVARKTLLGQ